MNLHLPSAEPHETLPTSAERSGAIDFPYGPKGPADKADQKDNLRFQLLKYIGLGLKHKYLVSAISIVFLFGGFVNTMLTTKIYSAYTTVKIDRSVQRVVKGADQMADQSNEFYQTQYELLKSRKLADKVAIELNLANSDFVPNPQESILDKFVRPSAGPIARDAAALKDRHDAAIFQIMGGLSIQPVLQSSIVRIKYQSPSPDWAQKISIAVAEQFEKMTLDIRFSASNYARHFLEERLQEIKVKLEVSEKQLIEYAQKEGIVDVDNKQPQVMTEFQGVQSAYSQAVTTRLLLAEAWNQAQADGGNSLPQVMSDSIIQTVRGKLSQLRANYQDRLMVVKPDFPEMIALRSQISEAEKDIRTQINLIKNSIKSQYDAALANEKSLEDKLAELKAKALDLRGRSVDYTNLYCAKLTQIGLFTTGSCSSFDSWASRATPRATMFPYWIARNCRMRPNFPSLPKNLIVALILRISSSRGCDLDHRDLGRHVQDTGGY